MRYYKQIKDGCILAVGVGPGNTEITAGEYEALMNTIQNRPTPPNGFDYRLTTSLEWELYQLPEPEPEVDEEATEADYLASLAELGVE